MVILIDGKQAVLDKDTSFEYVAENRMFTEADDYTLSIEFPLRGCAQNTDIFGAIDRKDIIPGTSALDCVIMDGSWRKTGALVITEVTPQKVTGQFLSGRSAHNFANSFDDTYIDELDLGAYPSTLPDGVPVKSAWTPDYTKGAFVALPWVHADSGNIHNCAVMTDEGWEWHSDTKNLEWQPYLLYIVRQIFKAIDFTCDLSQWEADPALCSLLVCNTLPESYGITQPARALPHWTLKEFFNNLEPIVAGEFDFDHKARTATFTRLTPELTTGKAVCIEQVTDEFTREVDIEDPKCEYRGAVNFQFKDRGDEEWKFLSCDWFIRQSVAKGNVMVFDDFSQLFDAYIRLPECTGNPHRNSQAEEMARKVLYAKEEDAYFILRTTDKTLVTEYEDRANQYKYTYMLQPINQLGGRIVSSDDDAPVKEIEVMPVRTAFTDNTYGQMMFLQPGSYNNQDDSSGVSYVSEDPTAPTYKSWEQLKKEADEYYYTPACEAVIKEKSEDKRDEFYSTLYLGFYSGFSTEAMTLESHAPYPTTALWEVTDLTIALYTNMKYGVGYNRYSLNPDGAGSLHTSLYLDINPQVKSKFKFIADSIPDPRSIFLIKGKRYLCEKITATFRPQGMSQLLTGEFYPIVD